MPPPLVDDSSDSEDDMPPPLVDDNEPGDATGYGENKTKIGSYSRCSR